MPRWLWITLWTTVCLNLWMFLAYLVIHRDVGAQPIASPLGVLTCVILVLAPWITFLPIATRLRAPFFEWEAMLGWSTFGFVVTFVPPDDPVTRGQFLVLVIPMTIAISTILTPITYAVGRRVAGGAPTARAVVRARREGYLAAISVVLIVLLHAFGVLSIYNFTLTIAAAVLAEALMIGRIDRLPAQERPARSRRTDAEAFS